MAAPSQDLPVWVPIALGVALVGGVAWRFADSALLPRSVRAALAESGPVSGPVPGGASSSAPQSAVPTTPPAELETADTPDARPARIELLMRTSGARFVFDPTRESRVVTCESESLNGGASWRRLGDSPMTRSIALGGSRAAAPVLRTGRILCGDAILPAGRPDAAGGTRVGDVQSAVEWTGRDWRPVGLPVAQAAGRPSDGRLTVGLGYTADGSAFAVRGDRLWTASGEHALPGVTEAWAADGDGAIYAAIAPEGRRAQLQWAAGPTAAWQELAMPGDLRGLAADADRVWVAAGMLGRGRRDQWEWTRWPDRVRVDGVTGWGTTVVAWGERPDSGDRGALVVSRDGGATLEVRRLARLRPVWAAVDPHRPNEVLLLAEDGVLARAYLD